MMIRHSFAAALAVMFLTGATQAQHQAEKNPPAPAEPQSPASTPTGVPNAGAVEYVCPMRCTPPLSLPGKCPVCSMELVAVQPAPHGGQLQTVGQVQVEVVTESSGIHLYAYNTQGQPLDLRKVRGVATLQLKGDPKRYRYDMYPEVRNDQSVETLSVRVDLRPVAGRAGELNFQLIGLSGGRRPTAFSSAFMGPMSEQQQAEGAIAQQKVCPVSGKPLGSMGDPIPVTVGNETIYVCCAGCVDKAKANFAAYFRQLHGSPQLVAAPATDADAEAINLQKVCPVMGEPLGSMGTPIKVTGLERDVYLCCKGCLKFLEQDPDKYLANLPPLLAPQPQVTKANAADARFVAAQKLCPVMDEPLDGMGGPYKTVVEGRVVYVCCPGCAKKLHANPGEYLVKLAKQGVNPPLAK